MSVLKQYNTLTSQWEVIAVGTQGDAGITTGTVAPANTAVLWLDTDDNADVMPVPSGGSAGQVLAKATNTDYDSAWIDRTGSGNAVINGGFDIWQRGTSFNLPMGQMTADRWASYHAGGTIVGTLTRQAFTPGDIPAPGAEGQYFLRKTVTSSSGNAYNNLETPIEDVRTLAGRTVTLSFYARADAPRSMPVTIEQRPGTGGSAGAVNSAGTANLTTSWQRFSFTLTLSSLIGAVITSNSTLMPQFQQPQNTAYVIDIWGVQLEAGSTATPFRRNGGSIQAELAACQRYYYRSYVNPSDAYSVFGSGIATTTTNASLGVPLPVTMRVVPTAIDFANLRLTDEVSAWGVTTAVLGHATTNFYTVYVSSSGLTQFKFLFLGGNSAFPNSYIGFSAEL